MTGTRFNDNAAFARFYDQQIFGVLARRVYGDSGFYNMGYWAKGTEDVPIQPQRAAERLVELHLATGPPAEAEAVEMVVDAGCGLGATTALLANHYRRASVLGINISHTQLAAAAKRCPGACFAAMDAARMALADGSVDRLHAVEAAFYFDSREVFFREIRRVLKPNGRAVLSDIHYRRGFALHVPAANIGSRPSDYEALCRTAGLRIRRLSDITADTILPFAGIVAQMGYPGWARLIRTAVVSYCLVELEPDSREHAASKGAAGHG